MYLVLTSRPSIALLCLNALTYTAALDHLALDNSLLYNLTYSNSVLKIRPGKSVLNNTPLHDSALYKSVLHDSDLGNFVGLNFSRSKQLASNTGVGRILICGMGMGGQTLVLTGLTGLLGALEATSRLQIVCWGTGLCCLAPCSYAYIVFCSF